MSSKFLCKRTYSGCYSVMRPAAIMVASWSSLFLRYEGGRVLWAKIRNNHVFKLETIQVDWRDASEFCDTCLISKDGVCFNVHKCMLASRSEYFHSMLAGGWIEVSQLIFFPFIHYQTL